MLKLSEELPAGDSGNSLYYSVRDGGFWITFRRPDGYGKSWIIHEESTSADFVRACYSIIAKNKIQITASDDLDEYSDFHIFTFEWLKDGYIKLTHKEQGAKKQRLWSMKLTGVQLTDIAMSIEQYFQLD
ncbi:MAG: hypothetical protein US96_C0007G0009 [Candidatus Woesebacteria bacterium GW2011_GWB1_38_5b]|uniref:Uncharacterized protein n=1 Tax=Candidatus Woesebacteria bacterium GW2011_GWB1_38_5b TaxID=1618569 RepID=A0A0G0NF07_9BACT|nr:MAG: hypothetical protein US96_C0007G0009 [Candidatus Woesebacteria bacterium GW2011_GWB1_38_5b]